MKLAMKLLRSILSTIASAIGLSALKRSFSEPKLGMKRLANEFLAARRFTSRGSSNGSIAYRQSCRSTNQRKLRKAYRQRIASGAA